MFFYLCFLLIGCSGLRKFNNVTSNLLTPGYQSMSMDSLDTAFRVKLEKLIKNVEKKGYSPIVLGTYRSDKRQQFLYNLSTLGKGIQSFFTGKQGQGYTNASAGKSCHNHKNSKEKPASYAVDIVGYHMGFWLYLSKSNQKKHAAFFRVLGKEAKALKLNWGGNFRKKGIWSQYSMGWDPAHISDSKCKYK